MSQTDNDRALNLYRSFGDLQGLVDLDQKGSSYLGANSKQFGDILIAVAKSASSEAVKESLPIVTSEMAKAIAIDLSSAVAGAIVGSLIQAVLRGQDRVGKLLEDLRSEPFCTAQRMIEEALKTVPESDQDRSVRREKLSYANHELEKAFTLAQGDHERMLIRLLGGLCELELGARSYARVHLTECSQYLMSECDSARKRAEKIESKAETEYREGAAYIKENRGPSWEATALSIVLFQGLWYRKWAKKSGGPNRLKKAKKLWQEAEQIRGAIPKLQNFATCLEKIG